MSIPLVDLTGKRFGNLVVISRAPDIVQPNGRKRIMWNCVCDCGSKIVANGDNLKGGKTLSCGCYRKEKMSKLHSTHHATKTKLYGVWCGMKARCYNRNTNHYMDYGGRGITICDEWRSSFESFKEWADNNGYKEGKTIDRKNNDLGYSPDNCRWVDSVVQANNRRSNVKIEYNGETHNLTEWADIVGIDRRNIFNRYYAGWSIEKMLQP